MPSVRNEDVPDDVRAELRRRAAISGRSLPDHLLDELLDRIGGRSGGRLSFSSAVASVRHDREAR
jgi:plasmid stability protein